MSIYYCTDCKAAFDEPKEIVEKHGFDRPPYEHLNVCPECGSSDIDLAADCCICNKTLPLSRLFYMSGKHYCTNCFDHIPDPHLKPGDYGLNNI